MEEVFKIAGTSYRDRKEIESILCECFDFSESRSYLLENYSDGDRVYKYDEQVFYDVKFVEEPDNPVDPKAVRVDVDGVHIGYIKSGRISRLHNVLKIDGATARCIFFGGPYKEIYEYNDAMNIEKGEYPFSFKVIITTPESAPADDHESTDTSINSAPASDEPNAATSTQADKHDTPKGKWLHNPSFVILMLILFWPVGIYGMWKYMPWRKPAKLIVTIAVCALTIAAIK